MVENPRYKLRMFGVPIDGSSHVFYDNGDVYKNNITPESVLKNNNNSTAYHMCREAVTDKTSRIAKQGTDNNLYYLFTKIMIASSRRFLLENFTY